MNAQQAWQAALGQLQMEMSKAAFDTWVRSSELVSYQDGQFTIGVHNPYARDWLESRLSATTSRLLSGLMEIPQGVRFVVWQREHETEEGEEQLPEEERADAAVVAPTPRNPTLNSRYTFDTFVVGASNR